MQSKCNHGRRAIALAAVTTMEHLLLYAACDDGTLWRCERFEGSAWEQIEAPPDGL